MHLRREVSPRIERTDAHKFYMLAEFRIVTPERDTASWTAQDRLASSACRRGDMGLGRPFEQAHAVAFDQRIDREGTFRFPLAIAAVAAMDRKGPARQFETHFAAGATTLGVGSYQTCPSRMKDQVLINPLSCPDCKPERSFPARFRPCLPAGLNSAKPSCLTICGPSKPQVG